MLDVETKIAVIDSRIKELEVKKYNFELDMMLVGEKDRRYKNIKDAFDDVNKAVRLLTEERERYGV